MKHTTLLSVSLVLICMGCAAIATNVEPIERKRFQGKLMQVVSDNFKQRLATTRYTLLRDGDGQTVPLDFSDKLNISVLEPGMRIEILGIPKNGRFHVEDLRVLSSPQK